MHPSGNDTVVSFFITYELKNGPFGSLLDAVMVRPFMRRAAPKMLLGLKHYAETSELVTPRLFKQVKAKASLQSLPVLTTG